MHLGIEMEAFVVTTGRIPTYPRCGGMVGRGRKIKTCFSVEKN